MARARQIEFIEQNDFSRGVVTDVAPHAIPPGAVVASRDFMLDRGGVAWMRGGWLIGSTSVASRTGKLVIYANDFSNPNNLVWVGDNNHLYNISGTDKGTFTGSTVYDCVYRHGGGSSLMIFTGSGAIYKFNGTTLATLGGSPPSGRLYCTTYKTRLVAGGHLTTNKERVYFSPTPNIEATWDVTNSWLDADAPVRGFAPLSNMLLIFTDRSVERLIGTTPPPGTDFDHGTVAMLGLQDNRAVTIWNNNAIFCNRDGIFMTNGYGFRDLTAIGGRKKEWQELWRPGTLGNVCTGVLRNMLFISMTDTSNGSTNYTWLCNLNSANCPMWNFSNMKILDYHKPQGTFVEDLYAVGWHGGYVMQLSDVFRVYGPNISGADGDGTNILPTMTFRPVSGGMRLMHFKDGWLDIDMRDTSSDNPTMGVQVAKGYEAQSYSTVAESPFAETLDETPERFTVALQSKAATVKITQSGKSYSTEIYGLRVQAEPIDPHRLGETQ